MWVHPAFLLLLLATSCRHTEATMPDADTTLTREGVVEYPYAITKEEAVDELIATLESWEKTDLRANGASPYSSKLRSLRDYDPFSIQTVTNSLSKTVNGPEDISDYEEGITTDKYNYIWFISAATLRK